MRKRKKLTALTIEELNRKFLIQNYLDEIFASSRIFFDTGVIFNTKNITDLLNLAVHWQEYKNQFIDKIPDAFIEPVPTSSDFFWVYSNALGLRCIGGAVELRQWFEDYDFLKELNNEFSS